MYNLRTASWNFVFEKGVYTYPMAVKRYCKYQVQDGPTLGGSILYLI